MEKWILYLKDRVEVKINPGMAQELIKYFALGLYEDEDAADDFGRNHMAESSWLQRLSHLRWKQNLDCSLSGF